MQDNEKKPALRFKGFTDPWEQRKLGDLCVEFRSGEFISASDITETGEYPVFGGNGLRGFTDRFNHDGEYTLIGRQGALCGNVNFAVGKSYFTEHAIAVRADKKNQTRFLYYLFSTMDLGQYSGQSAQPGLAVGNLVELKSTLPDKQEQEKISGVLTALDTLITLHQRKYEKLVNIKKSMLDKMFPKNGASVPEIRFKGFTDPWEQRKFEEIAVRSSVMSDKKGLPRVEYEDIISGAGRLNKDIKLKESEKVGIVFHKGDVLYGKLRPYLQNWLLASFNGLAVGDFWVLQPQNTDSSFLYRLVQSQQFDEVANQSTGTKMPRADWKLVSKTKFAMPHSVDEQAAIGAYFEHLDTLITLHQRKLEKLQNIKKSCLEKMFV